MKKLKINGVVIDQAQTYNFKFIVDNNLFNVSQLSTVKDIAHKDSLRENILKANFTGDGKGTQWFVKGKNLIKYLMLKKDEEKNNCGKKIRKKGGKKAS